MDIIWPSFVTSLFEEPYRYLDLIPFLVMYLLAIEIIYLLKNPVGLNLWVKKKIKLILVLSFISGGAPVVQAKVDMSNKQVNRIEKVFNGLRANNLEILDNFYSRNVSFIDPLGTHAGLESVKKYYGNLYENVKSIRFEFVDSISQGDSHVVTWKMFLRTPSLNKGDEIILDGNSVIKFNEENLVSYHRDYFDMGEFIYENVPVLGWIISTIKEKMKVE